jgi:hypothetical protein
MQGENVMGMCPICNGMVSLEITCPVCHENLIDYGRIMDYYEKYDAYLPIDLTKMSNGIVNDLKDEKCPHFVTCDGCGSSSVYLVTEQ